jgi:hypothetical protein
VTSIECGELGTPSILVPSQASLLTLVVTTELGSDVPKAFLAMTKNLYFVFVFSPLTVKSGVVVLMFCKFY